MGVNPVAGVRNENAERMFDSPVEHPPPPYRPVAPNMPDLGAGSSGAVTLDRLLGPGAVANKAANQQVRSVGFEQ